MGVPRQDSGFGRAGTGIMQIRRAAVGGEGPDAVQDTRRRGVYIRNSEFRILNSRRFPCRGRNLRSLFPVVLDDASDNRIEVHSRSVADGFPNLREVGNAAWHVLEADRVGLVIWNQLDL